jgi:hypothetical protein
VTFENLASHVASRRASVNVRKRTSASAVSVRSQCSANLPSCSRQISMVLKVKALPVGGIPRMVYVWVAEKVLHATSLSRSTMRSSTCMCKSGMEAKIRWKFSICAAKPEGLRPECWM